MGTRGPHAWGDSAPATTILVFRNGDPFFAGRRVVLARRGTATFEALLEQLTERVAVPFGVRRLFTPTAGRPVLGLDALRPGGQYVAAGRERFRKLDYIHIVPRKPAKTRKLKEIRPVVHSDIIVPSRWQTCHRLSRHINVFTNGRLFIPPVRIVIPKFSLTEWDSVLATIGEKVSPVGGVRKLFTMSGCPVDSSKDLQDNCFYVAAGLETFKPCLYWTCPRVPAEVQQKYTDIEKHSQRKKKEDPKGAETHRHDSVPPTARDSVFYAKEEKQKTEEEPVVPGGAEGDVYKARTPNADTRGAPDVKEERGVRVEVPVDQAPAEIVKDEEDTQSTPDFEGTEEEESSWKSFKKKLPLRHNTKKEASLKDLSESEAAVPFPEKEQHDLLEEKYTPALLATPRETEDQRETPMGQQPPESAPRRPEETPGEQESLQQPSLVQPSEEQVPWRGNP